MAISLILALALGLARNTQPSVPDISDICQELAMADDGDTDESGDGDGDGEVFILPLTATLAASPLGKPSGEPPRALFASVSQPPAKPPPISA